jgi:hypothetical protein
MTLRSTFVALSAAVAIALFSVSMAGADDDLEACCAGQGGVKHCTDDGAMCKDGQEDAACNCVPQGRAELACSDYTNETYVHTGPHKGEYVPCYTLCGAPSCRHPLVEHCLSSDLTGNRGPYWCMRRD